MILEPVQIIEIFPADEVMDHKMNKWLGVAFVIYLCILWIVLKNFFIHQFKWKGH